MTRFASIAKSLVGLGRGWAGIFSLMLALSFCLGWSALQVHAQTAGQGALQGTVTDASGAVIPNAMVTATNVATNISTIRNSNSAGLFVISPVQPGTYKVQISAPGFKTVIQENVVVNALQTRVYNPELSVGQETQTVEVTAAPPVLDTADATLGLTVENASYTNLPIQMTSGQQRDPTAFASLTPGAQSGTRMPIIGGTGNYLGQLYLEGMPATTVNQQGDNRVVSLSMSVEAVEQFQVLTSTPPAEYMGAGAMNFTMKSGGTKYHGEINDYIRNTFFDTWCFTCKASKVKDALGVEHPAPKSTEHQNELSASIGGVVPKTHDKLFFFFAYDRYYYRAGGNPQLQSIPTQAMLSGDFTELHNTNIGSGGLSGTGSDNAPIIYDPTSNSCTGSVCTRTPFTATKNGVSTYNVIPSGMISPIAKAMSSFLPTPSNTSSLYNNYLGSNPSGKNNHLIDWRVDYNLNANQRISSIGVMGDVHYLNNFSSSYAMPEPYVVGTYADIHPKNYILEHVWTISPTLVNQLKYSFTRFIQPQTAATDGIAKYEPTTMGISNVPRGQASTTFPGAQFGTTTQFGTAYTMWTGNSASYYTQMVSPSTYALTDNVQWIKGKHSVAFGFSYLWEQGNIASPTGYSGQLSLAYNAFSTANYVNSSLSTAATGFSFASFMLGAVGGSTSGGTSAPSIALYPLSETGGRFHPFAPYFRDSIKVNQKLTVEVGLRWDYLPPFHEVKDRWTFLNPALTNPLTSSPGMLQFAGNWGGSGVSYGSRTPVHTYWKNFGPRLGFAYSVNPKTVIRSGFAVVYSQAGGVGGRGGYGTGTGQTGFNMSATGPTEVSSGASAGPSYWLNSSNTSLLGPGYTYPSAPTPSVSAQETNTGNYLQTPTSVKSASSVSYADPYFSGRAPEIVLWNFGIERTITPDLTLGVNYAGNESHFIINQGTTGSNARGYWTNQVNPKYLAVLGSVTGKSSTGSTVPILNAPATAANQAIVASYFPTAPAPDFFIKAAAVSSSLTIAQMLTAFPQYSTVSDTWGNVGNFSYHALQLALNQRMHKGLSFNVNYTYSKNLGDDGTYRSGFDIPAAAISGGTKAYKQNRIDRSLTNMSIPHTIHAYGVYQLPFGKGKIGSNSMLVRMLAGGWQFSGIYTFSSGTPLAVTWSGASTSTLPLQTNSVITAMPDINTAFTGKARNGKYGWSSSRGYDTCNLGINAYKQTGCDTAGKVQYIDPAAFKTPTDVSTVSKLPQYLIGNAPRTHAYQMRNPYTWNVDAGMRRSIPLTHGVEFIFEADAINVWNHVTFGSPSASWSSTTDSTGKITYSSTFGAITSASGNRDWQFAGHIKF
jgi:hypothetical protein